MSIHLLVATTNRGKLAEFRAMLAGLPVELLDLAAVLPGLEVAETGATFEENALLKARRCAAESLLVTIADDSGLEVDALGGRPGVRSARFAGEGATDGENNAALLSALGTVDRAFAGETETPRRARFRCVIALVDPWSPGEPILAEGRCEGAILREPRGSGGFGYDPLFLVDDGPRTMAELSMEEKNRVSHRAQALAALRPALVALIERKLAEGRELADES